MDYFEHYKRVNDLSDEGRRSHWKPLDSKIGQFLPANKEATIVDVGCGAGILLEWLEAKGYRKAVGVDPDRGQVEFCRKLGMRAEQVVNTAEWLREQSGIDLLIMKDILEHIPADQVTDILTSSVAALAEHGRIVIVVPNAAASFASYWQYLDATHIRTYTEIVMRVELEQAGFRIEYVGGDDTWVASSIGGLIRLFLRILFRGFRRLEMIAEFGAQGLRMPLALNMIIVARASDEKITGR